MTELAHHRVDNEEIQISSVSLADIDHVLKFYEANLGTWQQFIMFWDWRQNQNPFKKEPKAVAVKEAGKLVGCMSVNPVLIIACGQQIDASWQQDSLVLSSMREKGIGRQLINKASQGFELVLAKGTSASMYALRKSAGFKDVPNVNYLIRVEKPRPFEGRIWEGMAEYLIAQWRLLIPRPRIDKNIEVREIDAFDPSFDILATTLSKENILRVFKDQKYLNWRYIQCPGKHYKIFRAGGKEARGAIVISISGDKEGWIVDLVCSSQDQKCSDVLLARALNHFEKHRVARIWAFATLPAARKRLYRFGFLPTKKSPRFTYAWSDAASQTSYISQWGFWHGDGDIELYM